jgi:hypothetical protein
VLHPRLCQQPIVVLGQVDGRNRAALAVGQSAGRVEVHGVVRAHGERELARRNVGVDVQRASAARVADARHDGHVALLDRLAQPLDVHLRHLADEPVLRLVEQLGLEHAELERARLDAARLERVDEPRVALRRRRAAQSRASSRPSRECRR